MRARIGNGCTVGIVIFIVYRIVMKCLDAMWQSTEPLRFTIQWMIERLVSHSWLTESLSIFITALLIVSLAWLLGGISLSEGLKRFARWRAERAKKKLEEELKERKEKILFCARIKKEYFFGGYPRGIVTKIYKKNDTLFCNMCFPNLGGFITVPVPMEDIEISEESIEETLLMYISGGLL